MARCGIPLAENRITTPTYHTLESDAMKSLQAALDSIFLQVIDFVDYLGEDWGI